MKRCTPLYVILTTIIALSLVWGCGGDQSTVQEPIKIGAIFSVTGAAARLGGPEKNAAEMVRDSINENGGINGRPIQLIIEDDQGVEENTVNAMQKLINRDNVVAIIGPTRSGNGMAAAPIAEEYGVPLVSCAAAWTQLFPGNDTSQPMLDWVYKTPQNDTDCATVVFQDCQKRGLTNVAIVTGTTSFGAAGREALLAAAPEFGITIVADETYPQDATDLTPILTKIKAEEPQAVVNWSIVDAQALIAVQMKQVGLECQLYQSHGFGNSSYITPEAEGVLFPAGRLLVVDDIDQTDVQYDVLSNFARTYRARWGEEVSTFAGHAYDALYLVAEAIRRGEPTRESIRAELENPNVEFIGTAGVFKMNPDDHCGLDAAAFTMVTVMDGQFRLASAME